MARNRDFETSSFFVQRYVNHRLIESIECTTNWLVSGRIKAFGRLTLFRVIDRTRNKSGWKSLRHSLHRDRCLINF